MEKKEIRFISPNYEEYFRINDGDYIEITDEYGQKKVLGPCEYVDEYHFRLKYNTYHICQYAEILANNNWTVRKCQNQ